MGVVREQDVIELEIRLAEVMSFADLRENILERLQRASGASGTWLFAFGSDPRPFILGGSLAEGMHEYSADNFANDPLQAYARARPRAPFLSNDRKDFDFQAYLRSSTYAEFYRPNGIRFVHGLFPTGLSYGSPHMFGIVLSAPTPRRFEKPTLRLLEHLELPLRAAARRIMRFSELETSRDVLQFAIADGSVCAVWDDTANLAWLAPRLSPSLDRSGRDILQRTAKLAMRQLRRRQVGLGNCILGRPLSLRGAHGEELVVELSCVRTPEHRAYILGQIRRNEGSPFALARLTRAERRVLDLLVRGLSNREICQELVISEETVKTHVSRILGKLNVPSRAKAVAAARALGA